MRELKRSAAVCAEWVEKAENDLKNAAHTLRMGKECPSDTVVFHAQQCVEKYLKALLIWNSIEFPKTHDIEHLTGLMPTDVNHGLTVEEQRILTSYAIAARYPGDQEMPSISEAREAVRLARRVRSAIRKKLPPEARV
ncbi:MAG TPA: HEPN domain-containing protein [Candidatus Brocadiia bacterium]|nr:HEPN domain-containing protein [Candidatus Brocadiia bacterium]